jgi:hypothetical protein
MEATTSTDMTVMSETALREGNRARTIVKFQISPQSLGPQPTVTGRRPYDLDVLRSVGSGSLGGFKHRQSDFGWKLRKSPR